MTTKLPIRKKRLATARSFAEKYGVSIRSIQRVIALPRAEYEANSISRAKPWDSMGISRRTWYRHGKPTPEKAQAL